MKDNEQRMTKSHIYLEMRRRICLLDYQPGTRLNERELAAEFGISRTPMRDVLQKLEHNGLISSQHGHGTIVTSIDLKYMRDIYLVRMRLMDAMGDSTPAPRNPDILDEMRGLEARCDSMLHDHDKREFARVLLRLHKICSSCARYTFWVTPSAGLEIATEISSGSLKISLANLRIFDAMVAENIKL